MEPVTARDERCRSRSGSVLRHAREGGASSSTRAKHQRAVHAYLNAAHDRGYIAKVPKPRKGEHPTPGKREAGYFEDAELPRLFYELPEGSYRVLAATAIETGTRVGELAALTWGDVDRVDGVINDHQDTQQGRHARAEDRGVNPRSRPHSCRRGRARDVEERDGGAGRRRARIPGARDDGLHRTAVGAGRPLRRDGAGRRPPRGS